MGTDQLSSISNAFMHQPSYVIHPRARKADSANFTQTVF